MIDDYALLHLVLVATCDLHVFSTRLAALKALKVQ